MPICCYTGLTLSWLKTKFQNVGADNPPSTILIDDVPMEGEEEFIYLGSKQSSNGYCSMQDWTCLHRAHSESVAYICQLINTRKTATHTLWQTWLVGAKNVISDCDWLSISVSPAMSISSTRKLNSVSLINTSRTDVAGGRTTYSQ